MNYNLHGTITSDNYAEKVAETNKYKPHRLILSRIVADALNRLNWSWTIDGGNLMGAYRNGKMLPHDDDFDYVIYRNDVIDDDDDELKTEVLKFMAKYIGKLLPFGTEVRVVNTYAHKLEIYQPVFGKYDWFPKDFPQTDYHNVCCDLTLLLDCQTKDFGENDKGIEVLQFQHSSQKHLRTKKRHFFPIRVDGIEYEGMKYNCPCSTQGYLEDCYGYLGENAVYDPVTGLYRKREENE